MSVTHGIASTYRSTIYRCRCEPCTAANTERARAEHEARRARIEDGTADVVHGVAATYTNWGCRCEPCTAANSERGREYKARLRGES